MSTILVDVNLLGDQIRALEMFLDSSLDNRQKIAFYNVASPLIDLLYQVKTSLTDFDLAEILPSGEWSKALTILDDEGERWFWDGAWLRIVGDESKDGGYPAATFGEALAVLKEGGYVK